MECDIRSKSELCTNVQNNDPTPPGTNNTQEFYFTQDKYSLNLNWTSLDSCSNSGVTKNLDIFTNIRYCSENEIIEIITNVVSMKFDKIERRKLFRIDVY